MYTASIDTAVRAAESASHRMSWVGHMPPWVLRIAIFISRTWLVSRVDRLADSIAQSTFRLVELSTHVCNALENSESIDPHGTLEDMLDDILSRMREYRDTVQRMRRQIQIPGIPSSITESMGRLAAVIDEHIMAANALRWELLEHDASTHAACEGFVARSASELDTILNRIEHGA